MRAGELNRLVTIQVKTIPETQDTFGEAEEEWDDLLVDIPCAFEPRGSREFPLADKRWAAAEARFRMRYIRTPMMDAAKHRLEFTFDPTSSPPNVTTWNIEGVESPDMVEMHVYVSRKQ